MKRIIPFLLVFFLGFHFNLWASHSIGAEISYKKISGNRYQLTLNYFRDCTGAYPGNSLTITAQAPGCNVGRTITVNQISRKIQKPYGPAVPVTCTTTGIPTVETITYTGEITFTAAEATCANWVFSFQECCRATTGNLVGQDNLYTETKMNLLPGVINSSPTFDTLQVPVILANVGMTYNLSMAAIDPDGDSLVYNLVAPLSGANSPSPYQAYPALGSTGFPPGLILNPYPRPPYSNPFNPQIAQITGGPLPATYTPQMPMPSMYVNWNGAPTISYPGAPGTMIWEANPQIMLNRIHGELKFAPSRFVTGLPNAAGLNKYVISVMVEEYRKVNGVMTKLGAIRRETLIEVTDNRNANPEVVTKSANGQAISASQEIKLRPGTPLTLNFTGFEPDSNQSNIVNSNATYILPGATFAATSGASPVGTITWTPTAAHVRWQPYFFQVMFRDDANPVRGVRVETFAVRVSASGGVTGIAKEQTVTNFTAFPNPFSDELTFSLNLNTEAEVIQIYNLLGQKVDEISLKTVGLGEQKVRWSGVAKFSAGSYLARLVSAGNAIQTLKFTKVQ